MDPFEPPRSDVDDGARGPTERGRMPGVVIAAIVIVAILGVRNLADLIYQASLGNAFGLVISALIIVGFVRGHALAWQWGIVIPTLMVLLTVIGLLALMNGPFGSNPVVMAVVGATLALYVSLPILLSMRPAKAFFGLECPRCHEVRTRAVSFLFTKRRCRSCGFEWAPVSR
jgi:hypothetical protein